MKQQLYITDGETIVLEPVGGCPFCLHSFEKVNEHYDTLTKYPHNDLAKKSYLQARELYHTHHATHVTPAKQEQEANFLDTFAELGGAYFTYVFKQSIMSRDRSDDKRYKEVCEILYRLINLAKADKSDEGKAFFQFSDQVNRLVTTFVDMKERYQNEAEQQ